jgi:choline dehydrogenase-like flavoprotein
MSEDPRRPSERVDVCVIGSGPAGALVSATLADRGHDVVVLEAGPRFDFEKRIDRMEQSLRPSHDPSDVWDMGGARDDYTNSGEVTYPLNTRRVKGIGGSSLHWGGRLERFKRKDFEMQSRYGVATDWPISYEDLQPYYLAAEKELGAAGEAQLPFGPPREEPPPMDAFPPSYTDKLVAPACEEAGITLHRVLWAINSEPYDGRSECLGYGTCSPVCPSGAKYSADVHVEKAEARGARVLDRVPVQKLHHDEAGDRIVSAEYATPAGETHHQEAREFVVACGGVETPRLLLLSASETYPDGLANSSGAVGRYFEERPAAVLRARIDQPTRQHLIGFGTTESHQFYTVDDVPPGSIKLEIDNNGGPRPVDLALHREDALHAAQDVLQNPTDPAEWRDLAGPGDGVPWGDDLLETMREQYGTTIQLSAAVEELPDPENRITLNPDVTDDHGNPVPDVSWSRSDYAARTMDRAFEIMHEILDNLDAEVYARSEVRFWKGIGHHLGTTRMGTDPAESVVNPRLRTHDLENLSIVSSSVFVTGGAMQPTLTIAALALRAADHLDERL